MSYPRDEFDEVDENTARRGTYRAVNADPAKSPKGAIPLVAAGVVGLLIGGAMYVYAPRTASPQYSASTAKSSSAPASASASSAPAGFLLPPGSARFQCVPVLTRSLLSVARLP